MSSSRLWLGVVCLVGLLLLLATAVPAPFTTDDCNYLASVVALRHGTVFVPGTEGLPASAALYAFEPAAFILKDPASPVPPLVPPLYALIAFPFSYLGWRGLVLLNLLSTFATAVLVYAAARRLANQERAGWYAAALWLLGASTVEYAQGLWPHMLSVALVTAGMALVALAITGGHVRQAMLAGFLLALAAGVRYQDAVLLFCGFLALLIWGRRRWRTSGALLAGSLAPIATSALFNHARIHSWNPFSKGLHYISINAGTGISAGDTGGGPSPIREFLLTIWTRVFDYSAQPPFTDRAKTYLGKLPTGEIITAWGVLKKSWIQGSPWVLLGLLVILLAYLRRDFLSELARSHLRRMALPIVALLVVFGLAGVYRHDGMAFNQRYLLELAPLVAIAVAVSLANQPLRWTWLASGLALGVCAGAMVVEVEGPLGFRLQSIVPLILGGLTAVLGIVCFSRPRWLGPAGLAIAMCLAWSFTLHLSTDLQGSRRARKSNQRHLEFVAPVIPSSSPSAVLSAVGPHDGFCPLLLNHDTVIVTANDVPFEEMPPVLDALLAKRRVFMWLGDMPEAVIARLQARYQIAYAREPLLAEIRK